VFIIFGVVSKDSAPAGVVLQILFQDEYFVAVNKPSGFHVHPPEDNYPVPRDRIVLYIIRDLIKQHVYPVHRLDAGTSGVLLFALSSESAGRMNKLFSERQIEKMYHAVARGHVPETGIIESPLKLDSTGDLAEAKTSFRRLHTLQLPVPVGKKFPTARYSWVEVTPHSGRFHQIRRHFARISHPLLGDANHGDSKHNQFFRNQLGIEGLCLKAMRLGFVHPYTLQPISIAAPDCEKWNKIQELFVNSQLTP
jgi:tRNA pseudouridine65 synthase